MNVKTKNVIIPATEHDWDFKTLEMEKFEIKKPGRYKISFKPVKGVWNPINFRNLIMTSVM